MKRFFKKMFYKIMRWHGDEINNNMRDTIRTFDNKDDLLNFLERGLPNGNKA